MTMCDDDPYEMAIAAVKSGDIPRAIEICAKERERNGIKPSLTFLEAELYLKMGNYEKARELFQAIVDTYPDHRNAMINLGVVLGLMKRYEEAASVLEKVLEMDPENEFIRYNLAITLVKLNRIDEAIDLLKAIASERPENQKYAISLGETLEMNGMYREALDVYDRLLEKDPDNVDIMTHKILSLKSLKMDEEADMLIDRVLEIDPRNVEALSARAVSQYNRGDYREAMSSIEDAISYENEKANRNQKLLDFMRTLRFETARKIVSERNGEEKE